MGSPEEKHVGISRRDFVKGAAAGVAAVGVAGAGIGLAPAAAMATGLPTKWDYEADVVVVGYGGAGAVSAITASNAGASVLCLEKEPKDIGPNEDYPAAAVINHRPSTRLMAGAIMNFYTEADAIALVAADSRNATPHDVLAAWAKYATGTAAWLKNLGCNLTNIGNTTSEYPNLPSARGYDVYQPVQPPGGSSGGNALWMTLTDEVKRHSNISVLYESPATNFIVDPYGAVVGVVAQKGGKAINVKARRGVVLSSGGYEYNQDMMTQYMYAAPCWGYCSNSHTGDGIKMAQAVGADLWHMCTYSGRPIAYFPELNLGQSGGTPTPYIFVDKYGHRFMKEGGPSHTMVLDMFKYDTARGDFDAVPAWSVFDSTAYARQIFTNMQLGRYIWSKDNSVELAKGWIVKGSTLADLASKINQDPDNQDFFGQGKMDGTELSNTVATYNGYCAAGKDLAFGRTSSLSPVLVPPFYAIKMWPGGSGTLGGPRRNAKSQIVKPDLTPVPRLYGAGEIGSILGFLESGQGWNGCELIVSGQMAGKGAAAEAPWTPGVGGHSTIFATPLSVLLGQSTTLSGVASPAGAGNASILRMRPGQSIFETIASVPTSSTGAWSYVHKPTSRGTWSYAVVYDNNTSASASVIVK